MKWEDIKIMVRESEIQNHNREIQSAIKKLTPVGLREKKKVNGYTKWCLKIKSEYDGSPSVRAGDGLPF